MGGCSPIGARLNPQRLRRKKTLASLQNIENKGPEIFLPPRSMVLKVVRGKILETLELAWFPPLAVRLLMAACSCWRMLEVLRFHQDGWLFPDWNPAEPLRLRRKKTLASLQNIENKGSEFFLPPRSMVLKVVRGKILETLKLRMVACSTLLSYSARDPSPRRRKRGASG